MSLFLNSRISGSKAELGPRGVCRELWFSLRTNDGDGFSTLARFLRCVGAGYIFPELQRCVGAGYMFPELQRCGSEGDWFSESKRCIRVRRNCDQQQKDGQNYG